VSARGGGVSDGTKRTSGLALALVLVAILVLTLWPLGPKPGLDDDRLSMRFALADFLRNVMLFLPLGIALSARGYSVLGAVLRGILLSACIELAQVEIPGRFGNLSDVMSNSVGALLGVILHRTSSSWLWAGRRGAERLALGWSVVAAAAVLGAGLLLQPSLPDTEYFAGWTLELGNFELYSGRIQAVSLGTEPLPNGRLGNSAEVRALWLAGTPLRVEAHAGAPTTSLAPIFTIHDVAHREILLIGAERGDLVLRVRTWAQAVSLDRPALRWPGILDDVKEGQPITIGARRDGNGWCLTLGDRSACPLGFTAGSGWRLLWFPHLLPAEAAPWFNCAWLALLFLPLGLWLRFTPAGALACAIAASSLFAAPLAGLLPTPPFEIAGAAGGFLLGAVLQPLLARRRPRTSLAFDVRALPLR
jgi:VanZ family protein